MIITDLNPEGGIGANSHLIEFGSFSIIVDSGINPKLVGEEALPAIRHTRGRKIDLVLLTHCHLDHLGSIPVIMREHPDAMLVLSAPSMAIARRMLYNSCNVMKRQKEELGIESYPLYMRGEVDRLGARTFPLPFDHPRFFTSSTGERLAITLHRAGHIPGAAGVTLEYNHQRLFLTGDVLFTPQRILAGAQFPRNPVDSMLLETTRGATAREPGVTRETEIERLLDKISEILARKGSVLIPAFALGRMQEVFAILHQARLEKRLPKVPIFASGLGLDLVNYFDEIARKTGEVNFRRSILKDLGVQRLPEELKPGKPPKHKNGAIYVLSSGMVVEKTGSYVAAASLIGSEENGLCFVGYCDPDAPGGVILASKPGDRIVFSDLDYATTVKASIDKFDLSSHADREELLDFATACNPRNILLTHGDPDARQWFQDSLATALPNCKVIDPKPLKAVDLG